MSRTYCANSAPATASPLAAAIARGTTRRGLCNAAGSCDLDDDLDLDAGAERDLRDPERAARVPSALSPKTSASSSEQPLVTRCCSVNSGVLLTRLITLTMRTILSRSPTATCSVPIRSIAIARAGLLAGGGVDVAPELADLTCRRAWRCAPRRRRGFRYGQKGVGSRRTATGSGFDAEALRRSWTDGGGLVPGAGRRPDPGCGHHAGLPHGATPAGVAPAWLGGVAAQLQQGGAGGRRRTTLRDCGGWCRRGGRVDRAPLGPSVDGLTLAGIALAGLGVTGLRRAAPGESLPPRSKGVTSSSPASWPACPGRRGRGGASLRRRGGAGRRTAGRGATAGSRSAGTVGRTEDAALQPGADLRAGQRWRFGVRLRQPHGNANPARLRLRAVPLRAGLARDRLCPRHAANRCSSRPTPAIRSTACTPVGARRDRRDG